MTDEDEYGYFSEIENNHLAFILRGIAEGMSECARQEQDWYVASGHDVAAVREAAERLKGLPRTG